MGLWGLLGLWGLQWGPSLRSPLACFVGGASRGHMELRPNALLFSLGLTGEKKEGGRERQMGIRKARRGLASFGVREKERERGEREREGKGEKKGKPPSFHTCTHTIFNSLTDNY